MAASGANSRAGLTMAVSRLRNCSDTGTALRRLRALEDLVAGRHILEPHRGRVNAGPRKRRFDILLGLAVGEYGRAVLVKRNPSTAVLPELCFRERSPVLKECPHELLL